MFGRSAALAVVALAAAFAQAKYIVVSVGGRDSMFVPRTVTADVGDIVAFVFTPNALGNAGNHSIVQTSFDAPCTPLEGGFASPIAYYNDAVFEIQIISTDPIWFACGSTNADHSDDHCQAGEVGAVNPPAPASLGSYVGAALDAPHNGAFDVLNGTGSGVGSGVGASFYLWAPVPVSLYGGPYPYPTFTGIPMVGTPVPEPASTPAPTASGQLSAGAIAGIAVGAAVAALGLLFAVWRLFVRKQRAAQTGAWAQSIGHVLARANAVEDGAKPKPQAEMAQKESV